MRYLYNTPVKIAPHWIRDQRSIAGRVFTLRAWSFQSLEEARERLEAKARRLEHFYRSAGSADDVAQLRHDLRRLNDQTMEYSTVLTETVVDVIDAHNTITRNHYGAEVLNSTDTCFLDVDAFPPSLVERITSLFTSTQRHDQDRLLEAASRICREHAGMAMRVYRTARGWRVVAAAPGLTPDSPLAATLYRRLRVDPLYAALCSKQACWRARLTPKPYRMRPELPGPYPQPKSSAESQADTDAWVAAYREKSAGKAVCRLVDTLGPSINTRIVQEHDSRTGAAMLDAPLY